MNNYSEIVTQLNQEIYDRFGNTTDYFEYRTSGFADMILFDGMVLWSSEDDTRKWIEKTKDYEPLVPYIKKLFNELADNLHSLKFPKDNKSNLTVSEIKSDWNLRHCFDQYRHDKEHHLGLGDIKLSTAEQDELCDLVERFYAKR